MPPNEVGKSLRAARCPFVNHGDAIGGIGACEYRLPFRFIAFYLIERLLALRASIQSRFRTLRSIAELPMQVVDRLA